MGWSIGFDRNWNRDIGYGVPAYCDHPGCNEEIDRGLAFVCGGHPYGGDQGCGLYFCDKHLFLCLDDRKLPQLCERCRDENEEPFEAKPDHPTWIRHKLLDSSWAEWRAKNREWCEKYQAVV